MSFVKHMLFLLLVVVLTASGWRLAFRFTARPTLAPYVPLVLPKAPAEFVGLRDMGRTMKFLRQRGRQDNVDARLMLLCQEVNPFQDLDR